jgi:hypothetical protein
MARNNRNAGTRNTQINNLLSELMRPKKDAKNGVSPAKLAGFLAASAHLRTPDSVPEMSGNWLVAESPFKWADAQDHVVALKKAGYRSVFVKGNRVGVHVKDLAA